MALAIRAYDSGGKPHVEPKRLDINDADQSGPESAFIIYSNGDLGIEVGEWQDYRGRYGDEDRFVTCTLRIPAEDAPDAIMALQTWLGSL